MKSKKAAPFVGCSPRLAEMHDRTITMAYDDNSMRLAQIDSAAYLLPLTELSEMFPEVGTLRRMGVSTMHVREVLRSAYPTRARFYRARKDTNGYPLWQQGVILYTHAATHMFSYLGAGGVGPRATDVNYPLVILDGILKSDSPTVAAIFRSKGFSVEAAIKELGTTR
jgi:hypothetical protein